MTTIIFDPDARTEFLAAVKYYEECQPGLGRRFRFSVESTLQKITEAPFRYRILAPPFRRYLLQKFPYTVVYTIEPDHIRIIAIAHTKRKPGYWLSRAPDAEGDF
ncbi:MAG: type II toxin-antitoxin system RelE/ParE family toxin [Deltaproteobacteria bacterium]|nr:type II toxin-antitoxin system RelE/ParE family toxin [Deltaproteobacteria bacterium]